MRTDKRPRRILVAGLGNLLLQDDGVGVHGVRALGGRLPRGAIAVEVGAAVLDALHLFEWADRVVAIDAMQAGGPPGTIYSFGVDDVACGGVRASLHELSLKGALEMLGGKRPEVTILGVEPGTIAFGMELSPPVAAALPRLTQAVQDMVERDLAPTGRQGGGATTPTRPT